MNLLPLTIGLNPSPYTQALFDGSVRVRKVSISIFNHASAKDWTTSARATVRSSPAKLTAASFPFRLSSWPG